MCTDSTGSPAALDSQDGRSPGRFAHLFGALTAQKMADIKGRQGFM